MNVLFDPYAELEKIENRNPTPATFATSATNNPKIGAISEFVAKVADVAAPQVEISTFSKRSPIPGERSKLPERPPACSICGEADWLVSLGTLAGGPTMHVTCWKKEQKQ